MTKEIQLTQGKVAIVDDADYEYLSQFKWYAYRGKYTWYARRHSPFVNGKRKTIHMHRVILNASGELRVDHRDGDGLNNIRENLRQATIAQNDHNRSRQSNNASGYKGVCWHKGQQAWVSHIDHNGKRKHLGYFATAEEAAHAYNGAAKELHGDFAKLNFAGGVELA